MSISTHRGFKKKVRIVVKIYKYSLGPLWPKMDMKKKLRDDTNRITHS